MKNKEKTIAEETGVLEPYFSRFREELSQAAASKPFDAESTRQLIREFSVKKAGHYRRKQARKVMSMLPSHHIPYTYVCVVFVVTFIAASFFSSCAYSYADIGGIKTNNAATHQQCVEWIDQIMLQS